MNQCKKLLLVLCFALSVPAHAGPVNLASELITNNVQLPMFVTHAPSDFERIFIVEQDGRVRIIKNEILLVTPFLDITDVVNSTMSAWGMRQIVFHPEYQINGLFYVLYIGGIGANRDSVIARYQVSADPEIADPSTGQLVLVVPVPKPQDKPHHLGNWIGFGPNDGYLYFSHGDGHRGGATAQDINTLIGKILRIDINGDDFPADTDRNYAIPPNNPFVGIDGADEVWAYGVRQPWRCSFDRQTGDFYFGDVGAASWEEINFQAATSRGGENYGWDCKEGTGCHSSNTCDCKDPTLVDPIVEFVNPPDDSVAVIGGYVYRGCAIPDLDGAYLFADYSSPRVWMMRYDTKSGNITQLQEIQDQFNIPGDGRYSSFGEDAFGEIYICQRPQGRVYKIVPGEISSDLTGPLGVPDGCVDAFDLGAMLGAWCSGVNDPNPPSPPCENCTPANLAIADISGAANLPDGCVDAFDLAKLLAEWCSVAGGNPCGTCGL